MKKKEIITVTHGYKSAGKEERKKNYQIKMAKIISASEKRPGGM